MTQSPGQPAAGKSRRPRLQRVLLGIIALCCIVGATGLILWRSVPSYWTANQKFLAVDNATLLMLESKFEQNVTRSLSGEPLVPGQPFPTTMPDRVIRVPFDELNAWLSVRLEDWLANQDLHLPPQVRDPMVAADGQDLIVAFRYTTTEIDQIISIEIRPVIEEDGKMRLIVDRALGGRLPFPFRWISKQLAKNSASAAKDYNRLTYLLGEQTFDPLTKDPGHSGRNLRLLAIHVDEQGIDLTVRSEPRPRPATRPASHPATQKAS